MTGVANVDCGPRNVLSLCAGIGGLDRGVRVAIGDARTVCYVEREAYCAAVLAARMAEGRLDSAPVWTDLRTFDGRPWRGVVDILIGGYPCQPFSAAGLRRGAADPRHLWPDVARVLRECAAPIAFFENVRGHVSLGLREVRADLEALGYCVDAEICSAAEVGAPHRRERVFILAYAECARRRPSPRSDEAGRRGVAAKSGEGGGKCGGAFVGRSEVLGHGMANPPWPPGPADAAWETWAGPKPAVCRDADGIANRVERLRALGGAVVDQQAALAFRLLTTRLASTVTA